MDKYIFHKKLEQSTNCENAHLCKISEKYQCSVNFDWRKYL